MHTYIKLHGQQNIKKKSFYIIKKFLNSINYKEFFTLYQ